MKDYDVYHVGVSGGKDSQALLLWAIHESGFPLDKIKATFCDTGNEHKFTYDHIKYMSQTIHPIDTIYSVLDFYALAKKKKRFPSPKARFCTQILKIFPSQAHILQYQKRGFDVLMLSGVRASESSKRSKMLEFEFDDYYYSDMYRPLLLWSIDDVWSILKKYNSHRNPLYDYGARRVGCFPCIMSSKSEIRNIATNFPERIDLIRAAEKETGLFSTFYPRDKVPVSFRSREIISKGGEVMSVPTIDDVVNWSFTQSHKPNQYEFVFQDYSVCSSNLGSCE